MITPQDWEPVDGLTLEPNALEAAKEIEHSLALTAGPGAGKTEMLAQRADFLFRTGICPYPKRILAISFKVDASRNLKQRIKTRSGKNFAERFDSYTFHAFAKRIIDRFRPVLLGDDALDVDYQIGGRKVTRRQIEFGDLVPLAIKILEDSQVARNAIRKTYSDVFLDEFQDCTNLQYNLVKLAFEKTDIRLIAVGDTKQKIMAWAGALDGIFSTFADDFNAKALNLYLNFRSESNLLRVQNEIIRTLDPSSVMPDKHIIGDSGEVFIWSYETSRQEAEHLAAQIYEWATNEAIPYSEIAILVSKQPDLYTNILTGELEKLNIPCRNEQQLQDLSVEPIARLIIDYLLCIYGTREPEAWIRLMEIIVLFSNSDNDEETRSEWNRFIKSETINVKASRKAGFDFSHITSLLQIFLDKIGISNMTTLSPDYESQVRLNELIASTIYILEESSNSEQNFLKALTCFSEEKSVRILTIHKSKGLEFDSVIILGIENETFWGNINDERCAYFVGISRAKKRLVLTTCQTREIPPSHPYRWNVKRTPHDEFINYAQPFIKQR